MQSFLQSQNLNLDLNGIIDLCKKDKETAKYYFQQGKYDIAIDHYLSIPFGSTLQPENLELQELATIARLNIALCDLNLKFFDRAIC